LAPAPGGYVAAIRAAQLGLRTAIVERENLGGVCLNWGCIPTKALLKSGEVFEQVNHLADYGLKADGLGFDFGKIVARSRASAAQLSKGVAFLMRKNKIEVIDGAATLEPGDKAPTVVVALKAGGERRLTATSVILATGARARTLPPSGLSPTGTASGPTARPWSRRPRPSRCWSSARRHRHRVRQLLPRARDRGDGHRGAGPHPAGRGRGGLVAARKAFEKRGIKFRTGVKVTGLTNRARASSSRSSRRQGRDPDRRRLHRRRRDRGEHRRLGLEALGVDAERGPGGHRTPTARPTSRPLRHRRRRRRPLAGAQGEPRGVHTVEHIAGLKPSGLTAPIPGCTYSSPQIASIGLTEAAAKAAGHEVKVGRFPFRANGRAIAGGETDGFIKTVFDAGTGRLIGAHLIGAASPS
jgi:dihydrolipoamide dehydrogenase